MVVWTDLSAEPKEMRRALLQTFNGGIMVAATAGHAIAGNLDRQVWLALAAALPGTLAGAWLGGRLYRRLGDRGYRRVVLLLLLASGAGLVATAI